MLRYAFLLSLLVIAIPVAVYAANPQTDVIEFKNVAEYIKFENKMKADLNMPIIPTNYLTGQPEPTKQITTDYTVPIFNNNKTDPRIIVTFTHHADLKNQKVITIDEAKTKGWNIK